MPFCRIFFTNLLTFSIGFNSSGQNPGLVFLNKKAIFTEKMNYGINCHVYTKIFQKKKKNPDFCFFFDKSIYINKNELWN